MASVRKRSYSDGTVKWVVDFKDELGKRRLKTFLQKKTADAFKLKTQHGLEVGTFVADANTMLFRDAVQEWLKHIRKRAERGDGVGRSCSRMYDDAVRRALDTLGGLLLTKVTTKHVQATVDHLCSRGLSGSSVSHTIRMASMVFQFGVEQGWVKINPVDTKKLIMPRVRKVLHIPSKEELRSILQAACEPRRRGEQEGARRKRFVIIALAVFGVMRRGEIAGLKWEYVDFARGVIHIRHSQSLYDGLKGPKSAAGVRTIPLVRPIAEALRGLAEYENPGGVCTGFVLKTYRGKALHAASVVTDYWAPLIKRLGLVKPDGKPLYRFHDLRHTGVSLLIEQGLSPIHIKNVVGHSSVTTTLDVYGHLFPNDDAIKVAAEQVAERLTQPVATRAQLAPLSG